MQPGEITYLDLRPDSWQSYVEREEQMERKILTVYPPRFAGQAKLPLVPPASTHGATCAKCGRAFTTPWQYRYRGADGAAICRDARACLARAEAYK